MVLQAFVTETPSRKGGGEVLSSLLIGGIEVHRLLELSQGVVGLPSRRENQSERIVKQDIGWRQCQSAPVVAHCLLEPTSTRQRIAKVVLVSRIVRFQFDCPDKLRHCRGVECPP